VHANNHLKVLSGVGDTAGNLETALGGETFEIDEMYPVYNNDAKIQGEKEAEKSTYYALEAEKIHAAMYAAAKGTAAQGKESEIKHHWLTAFSGGGGYRWCFTQSEVCGSGQRHGYLIWGELVRHCPVQFRTTE
jgi:rubrerythrin